MACAIVYAAELWVDHLMENGDAPQSIFDSLGWYEKLVGAARPPLERYTAVVKIDSQNDTGTKGRDDICRQRAQTAKLLCRVDRALPKVIVLDKFYAPKECGEANDDLRKALGEVSQRVPVVIGRLVPDEVVIFQSKEWQYLEPSEPSLKFNHGPISKLVEGVVNIDPDTRKLPLQWQLFPSKEEAPTGSHLSWYPTLPLAAAQGYDDNLRKNHPRLDDLLNRHEHPYISFLREDEFKSQSILVSDVLAGADVSDSQSKETEKTFCRDEKPPKNSRIMSGKVVVIGEVDPIGDMHHSVVGKLPGFLMQANFIEALLDDRYYRAVPAADYLYGFVILLLLQLILNFFEGHPIKIILLLVVWIFVCRELVYLTVQIMHWYVNPAPVSLTAISVKILHALFRPAEDEL